MNFDLLTESLKDNKDDDLCNLLEFGFPLGCLGNDTILEQGDTKKIWKRKNHTGATEYPVSMLEYLENKSMLGPSKSISFKKVK